MGWFRNDARRPAAVAVSSTRCIACPAAIQSVTSSDSVTMRASSRALDNSLSFAAWDMPTSNVRTISGPTADCSSDRPRAYRHSVVARRVADSHPMSKLPAEGKWDI